MTRNADRDSAPLVARGRVERVVSDLRRHVDRSGLSWRDVARRTGVSLRTVQRLFSGPKYPPATIARVAAAVGFELTDAAYADAHVREVARHEADAAVRKALSSAARTAVFVDTGNGSGMVADVRHRPVIRGWKQAAEALAVGRTRLFELRRRAAEASGDRRWLDAEAVWPDATALWAWYKGLVQACGSDTCG